MVILRQDIRHSFRVLVKKPGFTALVVLTLGLGIGANTAVFGFLDRILLRRLPVDRPHELVAVKGGFSYPFYRGLREQSEEVFSGLIAHSWREVNLSVGQSERDVLAAPVSSNYFSILGVKPVIGRGFLAEEGPAHTGRPVAVISYRFWQHHFDADLSVLGKTIRVDDYPLTIVGVAPHGFSGTYAGVGPSVYVPLKMWVHTINPSYEKPTRTWLDLLWRPDRGMSRPQTQAALRLAAERLQMEARRRYGVEPEKLNFRADVFIADGSRGVGASEFLWRPFALLQVVAVPILLVACANVANMLLARGLTRQKEIAIRRAMGAGRGAIIRQLLTESTMLAVLAGACGVLLAHGLSIALRVALTEASTHNTPVGLDGRILVFATLVSLGSVLFFGLVPALQASRPNPIAAIRDDAGAVFMLGRRRNLRHCLVVVQIALSAVALTFGGLCIRSLLKLRFMDPGFDHTRVLGISVDYEREGGQAQKPQQLLSDLRERIATYPGVQATSLAAAVPLSPQRDYKTGARHIENFKIPVDRDYISWQYLLISPGYFRTLGMPILRGRDFSAQDRPDTVKVMIVNELMAQRYWPDQDPIGKRVTLQHGGVRQVVGVVKAVRLGRIQEEPVPMSFWPITQPLELSGGGVVEVKPALLVRTKGKSEAVASLLRSDLDAAGLNPAGFDIRTSAEHARQVSTEKRMIIGILNVVGSVGLLLVATGVFSLMAFEMSRRTREIGIRMALGAQRADARRLVLRKGAVLIIFGLVLGIGLSPLPFGFVVRLLPTHPRARYGDLLYGGQIWDPLTYAGVALLVTLIAMAACWLPARRAARIDPMEALRYE